MASSHGLRLAPGDVLEGRYRLEEKLGEGGFGAVFRATQLIMDRHIILLSNQISLPVQYMHKHGVGVQRLRQCLPIELEIEIGRGDVQIGSDDFDLPIKIDIRRHLRLRHAEIRRA